MTMYSKRFVFSFFLMILITTPIFAKAKPAGLPAENDPEPAELQAFSENKVIPDDLRKVILTALSYYPELKHANIAFVFKHNIRNSVMQAQPKFSSIFRKKANRRYVVNMSQYLKLKNDAKIDIDSLPFDVLVGWIAHELGHIMDYKDRSGMAMMGFGFNYIVSKHFVSGAERRADLYAMKHGLGDSIMATKHYVLNHADIPEAYKRKLRRLYMSPEEFEMLLGEASPAK